MIPTVAIPPFSGKGESLANYAQEAQFRSRVTNWGLTKRPSAKVLRMGPLAPDVFLAVGNDRLWEPAGVMTITPVLHHYFAPNALDSVYREVACFLHFKRTTQTMGVYSVRFD